MRGLGRGQVLARVGGDWVAPGDLAAVAVADAVGAPWLLASFHGDSGGLSTQPVRAYMILYYTII